MLFTTLFRRSCQRHVDRPAPRPGSLLSLEALEDRTLPAVGLLFDASSGIVALPDHAGDNTIRESFSPGGFVELTLDGQRHSSDPASADFNSALAGATSDTLTGLRFDGNGGQDTLILGRQHLPGGLRVDAAAARVVTEDVVAAGPVEIVAQTITVSGRLRGGSITLDGSGLVNVEAAGSLATVPGDPGGRIEVAAGVFVNAGRLQASRTEGGQILVHARKVLNAGGLTAEGGSVRVEFTDSYIDTTAAVTSANGGVARAGGSVTIDGGRTGRLFSSGSLEATGSVGGRVDLFGREVVLAGARVDASGQVGGGSVRVGGDFHGQNPAVANARTVTVTGAATLQADARDQGPGGRVVVWADQGTGFAGSVSARGGPGGRGGFIEVSAKGQLSYGGRGDAGAVHGQAGTLLLDPKNLVVSAAPAGVLPQFDLIDPHPTAGGLFGIGYNVLSSGNVVVNNPWDDFGGMHAGAVYLFNGSTGALLSALVGSEANDSVGFNVYTLSSGSYVVLIRTWNGNRGAVTWGSGTFGVSGVVSEANSLVGSHPDDWVGSDDASGNPSITFLSNGNYVVSSRFWNDNRGAATWGNGSTGVSGTVSETNSLVGSTPGDQVGIVEDEYPPLRNANYVVSSPNWNGNRGAVTWASSTVGVSGVVSEANSLVGSDPNDFVGRGDTSGNSGFIPLSNGNYVVRSPFWNGSRGAVTWGDGTTGVHGVVAEFNSLVGSNANDRVGSGTTRLSNGNYLVASPSWNDNRGALTWGSGDTGVSGVVSEANSLVGSNPGDQVGRFGSGYAVAQLSSGNYVVGSPFWNGNRGAATWVDGSTGLHGTVSEANSLVGSNPGDGVGYFVIPLSNGNYVFASPAWNGNRGAVTWGSGSAGVSGVVAETNSLVGSNPGDQVGLSAFNAALSNGNYVVLSPNWNGQRGAVTWGDGSTGVRGVVSEANSLVGSNPGDQVGVGKTVLSNGNYLVLSWFWGGNRGAATWGDASMGVRGVVSEANSLVGSDPGEQVGVLGNVLRNGNYLIRIPLWGGSRGAVTWGDGSTGVRGVVSEANSLVGSNANDRVGSSGVTLLSNGNYVVASSSWNGNRGALTWGNAGTGVSGVVSEANSLVGSNPGDQVGLASSTAALSNGNYVLLIPNWNSNRGAVTWGDGSTGVRGVVSEANSLVGSSPGDRVGFGGTLLNNGNYVVRSPFWNGNRGAVTWGSGTTGVQGVVSEANSLVGSNPDDFVGSTNTSGGSGITSLSTGDYVVRSLFWSGSRGSVTWVNGATGQTLDGRSTVTAQNSLLGAAEHSGLGSVVENTVTGTFLVPFVTEGTGRLTAGFADPNQLSYALGQGQTITVTPEFLTRTLNTGTAVVLQASNDLTVNDPITASANGQGGALRLQAGRSILLNASITTDNGDLTLIANDTLANGVVDADRNPGSAVITTADGVALNTGTGALTVELQDGAGLTNPDSGAITLQTVTAGSVSVANHGTSAGSDVVLGSVTTAGAQSYANPNGTTVVTGNLTTTDSPLTFTDAVLLNPGLTLGAGSGSVLFEGNATIAPGVLTVAGGVALSSSATFAVTLNGSDRDSYSSVHASGPIDLGGSTLSLTLGFTPEVGDSFTLLSTDDSSPVTGTFAGLDEGAVFSQDALTFQITYQGGLQGNSVVLTRLA